ncbi:unnamed protein product, partial [Tetraodon nigroviridis]
GNKEVFSCQGIQLAVDWFLERGHQNITVFVPAWRKEQSRPDAPITDQEILRRLEKEKILVFTPSRRVQGRRVVCYDDRFIVKLAYESDGIIVSNDNYRDLANEKPEWKKFIDERLLMYSFVNDKFMPPDDPLGRHGPAWTTSCGDDPSCLSRRNSRAPTERSAPTATSVSTTTRREGAAPARRGRRAACQRQDLYRGEEPGRRRLACEGKKGAPKRQSDPSIRALSYSDAEEKLLAKGRAEVQKSACGSGGGSSVASPAPDGGPPPSLGFPQDQQSRAGTPHGLPASSHDLYPHCESPDLNYYSLTRAYSGLGLATRRSPDCRFPNDGDLRLGSMGSTGSECGSESSVSCSSSCDSYSERPCPGCPSDSLLEDGVHFAPPHSRAYAPPPRSKPGALQPSSRRLPRRPARTLVSPRTSRVPPRAELRPRAASHRSAPEAPSLPATAPLPPAAVGAFQLPRRLPLPPSVRAPPARLPARALPGTHASRQRVRLASVRTPVHAVHGASPPPDEAPAQLGRLLQTPSVPGIPLRAVGLPEPARRPPAVLARGGLGPGRLRPAPPAPRRSPPVPGTLRASSPLRSPLQHFPPDVPTPPPRAPPRPASALPAAAPGIAHAHRYGDAREKVYVNLCNIFPAELVGRVMARSPHVTDPQQLAAA